MEAMPTGLEYIPPQIFAGPIPIETYAQLFPEFADLYRDILTETGIDTLSPGSPVEVMVDNTLPAGVGGGYAKLPNGRRIILLNPVTFLEGKHALAHVLVHEAIHAGICMHPLLQAKLEGRPKEIPDESMTEALTKEVMISVYGRTGLETGYDGLVGELKGLLGNESIAGLQQQIGTLDGLYRVQRLIEFAVLRPLVEDQPPPDLSLQRIEQEVDRRWDLLVRLFPRVFNQALSPEKGLHEQARVSRQDYDRQHLIDRAAEMLNKPERTEWRQRLINQALERVAYPSVEGVYQVLRDMGYAYATQIDVALWQREIMATISQKKFQKPANEFVES